MIKENLTNQQLHIYYKVRARVAQGIEQQFPKLLVAGSIPVSGTIFSELLPEDFTSSGFFISFV